jgi:hypothetical protein
VVLVIGWRQRDVTSVALAPGPATPSDADVHALAAAATGLGLAVTLFPIVLLDEVGPGRWRGTLAPADVDAWWASYERFIDHHAGLAAEVGAARLSVGSELGSTEAWRDRWFHLIGRVRRRFTGQLIYSANWDHYRAVSFAARLDAVGVTGYFELTQDRAASEATLTAAWAPIRAGLEAHAATLGKPLWLTELGYPSRDGAATRPWDYTSSGPIDLEEQRRALAAFARAWDGSPLAGVVIWEWSGAGGPGDGGYTPRGKPAEELLRAWWAPR